MTNKLVLSLTQIGNGSLSEDVLGICRGLQSSRLRTEALYVDMVLNRFP